MFILGPAPTHAQTVFQFKSDELKVFNKQNRAVFTGNVHAWNDTGSLKANRLEVFYFPGGDTINYIKAYGNVRMQYPRMFARGEYAFRDVQADTMILEENAYVRRGNNEFWAHWIMVDIRNDYLHMRKIKQGRIVSGSEVFGSSQ